MKALIAGLFLLASGAAHAAGYVKPPGVPELTLPDGRTISVFAAQTAIGNGIGIFERQNGEWGLCGQCLATAETPSSFDSIVASAGGPQAYVLSNLETINAILAQRYPSVGGGSTGSTLDQVNAAFGSYIIRIVNGVPVLGSK